MSFQLGFFIRKLNELYNMILIFNIKNGIPINCTYIKNGSILFVTM